MHYFESLSPKNFFMHGCNELIIKKCEKLEIISKTWIQQKLMQVPLLFQESPVHKEVVKQCKETFHLYSKAVSILFIMQK